MPAPKGNTNSLKNGTRLQRLTVGELPRQLNHVKIEGRRYRRQLEAEVLEVHGRISANHAHHIDTASAATIHAGICRWIFREKLVNMEAKDILLCSTAMLKAKQARDSAVKELELDTIPMLRELNDILQGNGGGL